MRQRNQRYTNFLIVLHIVTVGLSCLVFEMWPQRTTDGRKLASIASGPEDGPTVEFYLYPTVGTVLIHSVKPELTE